MVITCPLTAPGTGPTHSSAWLPMLTGFSQGLWGHSTTLDPKAPPAQSDREGQGWMGSGEHQIPSNSSF